MIKSQVEILQHYENVAKDYEGFILASDPKSESFRLETILQLLDVNPNNDIIVDLGAGTGSLGLLWKKIHPSARYYRCAHLSWRNWNNH